jgi:predicted nucleotidyltransferase
MTTSQKQRTASYADRIVKRLKPLDICSKIILFGSRIWGAPHADSDLDLLVVLEGAEEPHCSADKSALYKRVSAPLHDLQREVPMDLLVHTEDMHRRFVERDSMFARKVLQQGKVIYEHRD